MSQAIDFFDGFQVFPRWREKPGLDCWIVVDEMEGLARNDRSDILSILNNGYKTDGAVDQTEGDAGNRRVVMYSVYTPIAVAGITGANATTTSRTITLNMRRGADKQKLNRELPLDDIASAGVRAGCYRLILMHFNAVKHARSSLDLPPWLVARHRELYAPLLNRKAG